MRSVFQILSDGSCDLTREQLSAAGLEIVPYYISFDGKTYRKEMKELDVHEFFSYCVEHPDIFPQTSMPTIQDYIEAFEPYLQRGIDVLCYCLTAKFSGSFASARNAADMMAEKYPNRTIRVVDSTLVTGLQGLLLLELSRYASEGHTLEETYARGEEIKADSAIYFTLENLAYLAHGGRIGKLVEMAAKSLDVRPLVRFGGGELNPVGVSLGRKRAYARMTELVRKAIREQKLDLEHYTYAYGWGYSREEAEPFFDQVRELFRTELGRSPDFVEIQIGATIGVHTGPHPVGIGFIRKA